MVILLVLSVEGNASSEHLNSQEFADTCYDLEREVEDLAKKLFDTSEISGIEVSS